MLGKSAAGDPAMAMFDLSGKVALITGSSRGIGKAIAMQMALHGARVVISSRKPESCEATAAEITAAGGTALAHACHVGHKAELQTLVDASIAKWGRIDIVVCNAAANPHFGPSATTPDEAFDRIIQTNFSKALWADPGRAAAFARANPLRRLGDPDDVAGTAVLLASRAGNFITGQTVVVDGGGLIGGGEPLM